MSVVARRAPRGGKTIIENLNLQAAKLSSHLERTYLEIYGRCQSKVF